MIMGFTGSRDGLTIVQSGMLLELLAHLQPDEFHHGDCVGADEAAHYLALQREIFVVIHPPLIESSRAFCKGDNCLILPPQPYLVRNREIVDIAGYLIACPSGPEKKRSGTWSTIRYAREVGKEPMILMPRGPLRPKRMI